MDIQNILLEKANQLGYRCWFFNSSDSHCYSLRSEKLFASYPDAIKEAKNINCIWFDGEIKMPALFNYCGKSFFEGLCKLNNLKELIPPYYSKYYLIVEDAYSQKTLDELSKPTFYNSGIIILKKSELLTKSFN